VDSSISEYGAAATTLDADTAAPFPDGPHEFHRPKWFNFALDRQRRWLAEVEREVEMLFAA
jgi:hypothetical protein